MQKAAQEYNRPLSYVVENKIDGLASAIEYRNGKYYKGATRGNGIVGEDVTREFIKGAKLSLELAKKYKPDLIILKAKSPSCGKGKVYDGTFSKALTDGNGVACQILIDNGFNVITEDEL